ncbi:hypothetical protein [Kitasatospora sp. NPDC057223]|uniref:hypothetical protein n=1 Tax=Kitasatospora sp. NPDC057223 TaxID=3346055 RepID=UPI0036251DCB
MVEDVRQLKILRLLISLTQARKIEWESATNNRHVPGRYSASIADATFSIWSKDGDGLHPYIFEMYNGEGDQVGLVRSRPVDSAVDQEMNDLIQELHQAAHRNATNIDAFLDHLIEELEREDGSPF